MVDPMDIDTDDSTYMQVRYKKLDGTLVLSSGQISFLSASLCQVIAWNDVIKHQVSPASYPKSLLKLVLTTGAATFQLPNRTELERIRIDITQRLKLRNGNNNGNHSGDITKTSFGELDPTAVAVARSSLLAANPALRQQHAHLVQETQTLSEDDFWQTHQHLVEEEYARMSGMAKAGTSSLLQSHLPSQGRVILGVEEMRQIFILYPAVHKAYEEKVPLELSDEQFWRKYLESEYFHRDRGRMGALSQNVETKKQSGPSIEEQEARAAAVGTDDMFSRYDQKIKEVAESDTMPSQRRLGRKLAIGQFDLASTYETERSRVLESKDEYPLQADDGKGARVIQKYNRHWAMVLHPDEAVAGANLKLVARSSVKDVLPNDTDPVAGGGVDAEMQRLVEFASTPEEQADHAIGVGHHDDFESLMLRNVDSYFSSVKKGSDDNETVEDISRRHMDFATALAAKAATLETILAQQDSPPASFPQPPLGRELLSALTKKMAQDSKTEAASIEMVNKLPEDFLNKLHSYFRRSSELLRHFFGLRELEAQKSGHGQKLTRIVRGMETFYREMEVMRRELPQTESGEIMRKMCLPIMDQLDWAFKLHREGTGGRGGGGFVAVDES